MCTLGTPHQVQYSDYLHLVFKPMNINVLILIHLYCNVLNILNNNLNIAGRLSLHKLTRSSNIKKLKLEASKLISRTHTNIQAVHSLHYIVAKCHFFSVVT